MPLPCAWRHGFALVSPPRASPFYCQGCWLARSPVANVYRSYELGWWDLSSIDVTSVISTPTTCTEHRCRLAQRWVSRA